MSQDSRSRTIPQLPQMVTMLLLAVMTQLILALMTQLILQETINPRFGEKKHVISQMTTGLPSVNLLRSGTKIFTIFACPIVIAWLTARSHSAMVDLAIEWMLTEIQLDKPGALLKTWLITIQAHRKLLTSGSTPMAIERTWKAIITDAQSL